MQAAASKCYFPTRLRGTPINITATRVCMVSVPANVWLGDDFSSVRPTADAKRASGLLLFLVETVIRSKNVLCFESVYDSVLEPHGIKRLVFLRLWIFLETDERTDAFNLQVQSLLEPKDVKKRKRGTEEDDEPVVGWREISSVAELLRALLQGRMSQLEEALLLTFDHGGTQQDVVVGLDDSDDDDDAADTVADPTSSIVSRISAESHFRNEIIQTAEDQNRVAAAVSTLGTYMTATATGDWEWKVTGDDHLSRMRVVDFRNGSGLNWLASGNDLFRFKHPAHEPNAHELRTWLCAQGSIVGLSSTETATMSKDDMQEQVSRYMHTPALVGAVKCLQAAQSGVADWSAMQYRDTYPYNSEWMTSCRRTTSKIERTIRKGDLAADERRTNANYLTSQLNMFSSEKVKGFPPAYNRVRENFVTDKETFNDALLDGDEVDEANLSTFMFPDKDDYSARMRWPTIFLTQLVEILRCEFGLDRPQTHMDTLIYIWSFLLLIPRFGCPGSIQARGPSGSGKGEAKKRLQPCVNSGLWLNIDSLSEHATSFHGIPEQCFWDQDENQHQGKANGTTMAAQTADSNGVTKRARSHVKDDVTKMDPVACRHVVLGSFNVKLPDALEKRGVILDLPHNQGEVRTDQTGESLYAALCFRTLTGLSVWPHLWDMAGEVEFDETCLNLFISLAKVMVPDCIVVTNARKVGDVRYASHGLSLFEIISMYYRRGDPVAIEENNSYEFLSFLRGNAMLSPTAIWSAFTLISSGEDPNREQKVLAILKDSLRQLNGGMYESIDDGEYFVSDMMQLPPEKKDKELEAKGNESGLGIAILMDTLDELRKKKYKTSGKTYVKLVENKGGGFSYPRYAVLGAAVASMNVLTATEKTILEHLSGLVQAGDNANVMISADETQYIFKESIRNHLLAPTASSPTMKHGSQQIMAAVDMLTKMGVGFECESGLIKNVAVVHPQQLPTSHLATVGGPLNPTGDGPVYYGALPYGQVLAIDTDGLHRYEGIRDGTIKETDRHATAMERFANTFFLACGATPGELVFAGVGGADTMCAHMTISDADVPDFVVIGNPKYTDRAGRMSSSVKRRVTSPLFPPSAPTVKITRETNLVAKINAANAAKWADVEGTAYNYVGDT